MINQQILQSIECAIQHRCPKDTDRSKRCVECEIGYTFVACEPIVIECGHHVCKECDKNMENRSLRCKFCAKDAKATGAVGVAANTFFQVFANDLAQELKEKYTRAIDLFKSIIL